MQARKDAQKAGEPLPPEPEKPDMDKPFILDPLLRRVGSRRMLDGLVRCSRPERRCAGLDPTSGSSLL